MECGCLAGSVVSGKSNKTKCNRAGDNQQLEKYIPVEVAHTTNGGLVSGCRRIYPDPDGLGCKPLEAAVVEQGASSSAMLERSVLVPLGSG